MAKYRGAQGWAGAAGGRLDLRRDFDESLASVSDPAVGIRVGPVVMDELGSPVGDVRSEVCEKALYRLRNDPPQRAEGPFESVFVFPGEAVEELVKDGVEGGPLGPPGAVELRVIKSW